MSTDPHQVDEVLARARAVADREEPNRGATVTPPLGKCRSCRADVYWAKTATGADMPVDPEPRDDGNVQLQWNGKRVLAVYLTGDVSKVPGPRRVSHFATCPQAKTWRKP